MQIQKLAVRAIGYHMGRDRFNIFYVLLFVAHNDKHKSSLRIILMWVMHLNMSERTLRWLDV